MRSSAMTPHVWAHPKNAIIQVENIGYALEQEAEERGDSELKSEISQAVEAYQDKPVDGWVDQSIATVDDPVLPPATMPSDTSQRPMTLNSSVRHCRTLMSSKTTAAHIAAAAKTVRESKGHRTVCRKLQ